MLPSLQSVGMAWCITYKPQINWHLGTKMFWVTDSNSLCPFPSTVWLCRCKNSLGISQFRSNVSYILHFSSTEKQLFLLTGDYLHLLLSSLETQVQATKFGPSYFKINLKQLHQLGAVFSLNLADNNLSFLTTHAE